MDEVRVRSAENSMEMPGGTATVLMGLRIFTRFARRACKPQLKVMRPENYKYIISGLEEYWSPEQIIGHHGMSLCTATIYGVLKDDLLPTVLPEKLRQQGKSRKAEGEKRRGTIPDCISKGERPTEAAARNRVGDWEGDIVAGKW